MWRALRSLSKCFHLTRWYAKSCNVTSIKSQTSHEPTVNSMNSSNLCPPFGAITYCRRRSRSLWHSRACSATWTGHDFSMDFQGKDSCGWLRCRWVSASFIIRTLNKHAMPRAMYLPLVNICKKWTLSNTSRLYQQYHSTLSVKLCPRRRPRKQNTSGQGLGANSKINSAWYCVSWTGSNGR